MTSSPRQIVVRSTAGEHQLVLFPCLPRLLNRFMSEVNGGSSVATIREAECGQAETGGS